MSIISIAIVCAYIILIVYMIIGFKRVPTFKITQKKSTQPFSIITPFRNEAENLPYLINSISDIDYPKELFEIIFINDDSTDSSVEIIHQFIANSPINITLINNNRFSNSPKKDAITLGVKSATYDWIVTTDADCIVPKDWLNCFSQFIEENNPSLICGPVTYKNVNSWLSHFQNFELLSLLTFTIGAFGNKKPFLCNGANLCYHKTLFEKVKGYTNNNKIASGDDVFLLENALKSDTAKVCYLKAEEVLVQTKTECTITDTLQQRIRWASKTSHYKNGFGKIIGLLVLLMNGLLISLTILSVLNLNQLKILAYCFFIKMICDGLLILISKSVISNAKFSFFYFFLSSLFYPFFSVYVAIQSIFLPYKWKGRRFAK